MKLKIRKGSQVEVITGSEKGKRGEVLVVNEATMRVRVQGVKMMTNYSKQSGISKSEGFIHYSNVKLVGEVPAKKKTAKAKAAKSAKAKTA